ncbi:MAG TPA: lysylphosphatidylglycerol synthase domain-containing protein [Rhizomicrobium sp.]|nr:lysylphosphatidylglycerol synthase domain-containing protein [Rhizomicrobium sp.]
MKTGAIVAALAGLALAVWFVLHVGFAPVVSAVAAIGWGGFGLLCLYSLGTFLILGAAWFVLTPAAPLYSFVWSRIVRDAAGEVLPFSQIGGILIGVRTLILRGMPTAEAFASSIVDVTTEMMAQIVFILIGVALFRSLLPPATMIGIGFVLAGALAFLVLQRRGLVIAEKLAGRFLPKAARGTQAFHEAVKAIHAHPARLATSAAIHLLGWIASGIGVWLTIRLMGAHIDIAGAIAIEAVLSALRSAAVFVPGALGVQEAGYALLLPLFGLPAEMGLAVSLLKRAREIAIGTPVLVMWQGLEGRHAFAAPDA